MSKTDLRLASAIVFYITYSLLAAAMATTEVSLNHHNEYHSKKMDLGLLWHWQWYSA